MLASLAWIQLFEKVSSGNSTFCQVSEPGRSFVLKAFFTRALDPDSYFDFSAANSNYVFFPPRVDQVLFDKFAEFQTFVRLQHQNQSTIGS